MDTISIFNYEIFYLDYLEGKLSEGDVAMLMEFFEEHPECRLDDDELPVLTADDSFVYTGKSDLKQIDDAAAISLQNVDHFMISEAEGLLTDAKKEELDSVVVANPELEKERKRYGAVYFAADTSIVYQDKAGLKRKKAFVLWPYISAGVAAAIITFFLFSGAKDFVTNVNYAPDNVAGKTKVKPPVKNRVLDPSGNDIEKVQDEPLDVFNAIYEAPEPPITSPIISPKNENNPRLAYRRPSQADLESVNNNQIVPFNGETTEPVEFNPLPSINDEFENPIEPITSFISDKSKTKVDFGRKKATTEKKGGFFLKIGKFQISKNRH